MPEVIDAPAPAAAAPAAAPVAAPAPPSPQGVAAPPSPTPAPGPASAPAPAADDAPTVLDQAAPEKPFTWEEGVKAKFVVKNEDGTIDKDATAAKMARSYDELEKHRQGPRPKTAGDYAINVPDDLKDVMNAEDPGLKTFLGKAHTLGFSQAQLDLAMGAHAEALARMAGGVAALNAEEATAELSKFWKDPEIFAKNARAARRALTAMGDEALLKVAGNNPAAIRIAAFFGAQLAEDTPPQGAGGGGNVDVKALMANPAYSDASHADHARISKQVNDYYARQPGANQPIS